MAEYWRRVQREKAAADIAARKRRDFAAVDPRRTDLYPSIEAERAANMTAVATGTDPVPPLNAQRPPTPPADGGIAAVPRPRVAGQPPTPTAPLTFNTSRTDAATKEGDEAIKGFPTGITPPSDVIKNAREWQAAEDAYMREQGLPTRRELLNKNDTERDALYQQTQALLTKRLEKEQASQSGLGAVAAYMRAMGNNRYARGKYGVTSGAGADFNATMAASDARIQGYEDAKIAANKLRLEEMVAMRNAEHALTIGNMADARKWADAAKAAEQKRAELAAHFSGQKLGAATTLDATEYKGKVDIRNTDANNRTTLAAAAMRGAGSGPGGDKRPLDTAIDNAQKYADSVIKDNPLLMGNPVKREAAHREAFMRMFTLQANALVAQGAITRQIADGWLAEMEKSGKTTVTKLGGPGGALPSKTPAGSTLTQTGP